MCSGDENGLDFFFVILINVLIFLYCFDFLLVTIFLELRIGMKKKISKTASESMWCFTHGYICSSVLIEIYQKKLEILAEIKTG